MRTPDARAERMLEDLTAHERRVTLAGVVEAKC
jgi:hypothetical protein